jgi:hypothetical protein
MWFWKHPFWWTGVFLHAWAAILQEGLISEIFLWVFLQVRRLRIQQRIKGQEQGVNITEHDEAMPEYPSSIPFLPPLVWFPQHKFVSSFCMPLTWLPLQTLLTIVGLLNSLLLSSKCCQLFISLYVCRLQIHWSNIMQPALHWWGQSSYLEV